MHSNGGTAALRTLAIFLELNIILELGNTTVEYSGAAMTTNDTAGCFLNSTDKLFKFNEPTAYERNVGSPRWIEFAAAYKTAADRLVDFAITEPRRKIASIAPIIYLYRHSAELDIKSLLFIALLGTENQGLLRHAKRVFRMHDPKDLFDEIVEWGFLSEGGRVLFMPDRDETLYGALLSMGPMLAELSSFDSTSTTFRYPITKQLTPINIKLHGLSLSNLRQVMGKLAQTCSATRKVLEGHLDATLNLDQAELMSWKGPEEGLRVIDSNGKQTRKYFAGNDND